MEFFWNRFTVVWDAWLLFSWSNRPPLCSLSRSEHFREFFKMAGRPFCEHAFCFQAKFLVFTESVSVVLIFFSFILFFFNVCDWFHHIRRALWAHFRFILVGWNVPDLPAMLLLFFLLLLLASVLILRVCVVEALGSSTRAVKGFSPISLMLQNFALVQGFCA